MALSSPKTRSPWSSTKSSSSRRKKSSVCGRFGCRASCARCQGLSPPYTFCWSRLSRSSRRPISSRAACGSSAARSSAIRFSSSRRGRSNSSSSGIFDEYTARSQELLDFREQRLVRGDRQALGAYHDLLLVEQHVDEERRRPRVGLAEPAHRG